MHGTGLFNAISTLMVGGSITTMENWHFDPTELLDAIELGGLSKQHQSPLEIDDVDPVALTEDETLHLGIPTTGLMSEMDAGFQKFFNAYT